MSLEMKKNNEKVLEMCYFLCIFAVKLKQDYHHNVSVHFFAKHQEAPLYRAFPDF